MLMQLTEDCEKTLLRAVVQILNALYKKTYCDPKSVLRMSIPQEATKFTLHQLP